MAGVQVRLAYPFKGANIGFESKSFDFSLFKI